MRQAAGAVVTAIGVTVVVRCRRLSQLHAPIGPDPGAYEIGALRRTWACRSAVGRTLVSGVRERGENEDV